MSEVEFAKGIYFNSPHEKAPDYVKGKLSIQKGKFLEWLEGKDANEKGYINLNIKVSQGGKPYIAVDNWVPNQQQTQQQPPQQEGGTQESSDPDIAPF